MRLLALSSHARLQDFAFGDSKIVIADSLALPTRTPEEDMEAAREEEGKEDALARKKASGGQVTIEHQGF